MKNKRPSLVILLLLLLCSFSIASSEFIIGPILFGHLLVVHGLNDHCFIYEAATEMQNKTPCITIIQPECVCVCADLACEG